MATFVHAIFVLATFVNIRNISVVTDPILTKLWSRILGPSWTDSSCHGNICPGNKCPGNICPYQNYLSCYWPDFDQTLKVDSLDNLGTDSNCHGDICPGNICPGDICPYQEYLSCYWPDFDQNLKVGSLDHFLQMLTITVTFVQG